ncbi:MAG: HAD family hydrolase [Phycisphaerae bacterium]|nr:HAD family hydrolase [Phycisphaerae bacterium]
MRQCATAMRTRDGYSVVLCSGDAVANGRAYDLIAIDLDGTLLGRDHKVPAANRAALHRAHEAGMHIVLCTGRAYPETTPTIADIGLDLDAAVTVFGAVVTDIPTNRTIEYTPFDLDTARALTAWLQERRYAVLWLFDPDEHGVEGFAIDGPHRHPAVDGYLTQSPCVLRAVDTLPATAPPPVRISIVDEPGTLEPISAELTASFDGRVKHNVLRAPAWDFTVIEAFAPQVNKWFGIEKLCRRWNIDPARTVAVGDDVNDVDMLRQAGLGVAMGNARAEVKATADRVTLPYDECGVAALIDEILES